MSIDKTAGQDFRLSLTEHGDFYIRNEAAIKEIAGNVRRGHYCTILGPRYCQKSQLLRDVKRQLEATRDHICVLLNLQPFSDRADSHVLREVADEVDRRAREQAPGAELPAPAEVVDQQSLRRFFSSYVRAFDSDPVLLLDHLEDIRLGPLHSLLRALRAVYNERRPDDRCRLGVVISSSLIVSGLLLGETSPFNMARLTLVTDLNRGESAELIRSIIRRKGVEITAEGETRLLDEAGGDRYLLQQLCAFCLRLAEEDGRTLVEESDVVESIDWIIKEKAEHYSPLRETVYTLEDDPTNLLNVLQILKRGRVPRRELQLGLELAWDTLQLTGAVNVETSGDEKIYRIRNGIYRRYLTEQFSQERVAHVLRMAGQWEAAIDYLEQEVESVPGHRSALLGIILDSIHAAQSAPETYPSLARYLGRAFSLPRVRIYILDTERTRLMPVSQFGLDDEAADDLSLEDANRPEVDAYFNRHYVVAWNSAGEPVTLIPILRDEGQTLGVVAAYGYEATPSQQDFQDLLAFLKQMGRALGNPIRLSALYEIIRQVTGSLDLQQTMQTTVDEAIKAVPRAQRGILLLWDEARQSLAVRVQRGYRPTFADEVQMPKSVGYVGNVYSTGKPTRMGNVMEDPRTFLRHDPDIKETKSAICVPLKSWGRVIGVLCLDNTTTHDAFQKSDLELLSAFADQAAVAIQTAQLSTELNELGISINREETNPRQLFEQVVQSITRVSGAKAATMILLPDEASVRQESLTKAALSISYGLGPDYDKKISLRPDGLTLNVIQAREPIAVGDPEAPIGINPLMRERGIRAQIGLPMMIQEEIIGVLFVLDDQPHEYSKVEIRMLSLFANQAAMAIKNKRLRDQIHEALRLTSRMVAHRLRNVLPVISDQLDRVIQRGLVSGDGLNWSRVALNEARRAQRIVSDFETFSRSQPFDCPNLLPGAELSRRLHEVVRVSLTAGDASVEIRFEPDLPVVRVNFDRLSDDFRNFARDSERHRKQGFRVAVRGEVSDEADAQRLSLRRGVAYLRLVYTDNGPGIPEERKERIYEAFHTTTDGSGLGLAIAKHNAKVHGGAIIECGQPGSGVRFEIYLPVVSA